jgi:parallel beta-helix repeat protein
VRKAIPLVVGLISSVTMFAGTAMADDHGHNGRELRVDDDHAQCPTAQFTRIQDAVNAAQPGDKIVVCPGRYVEQVTIPASKNNLTLVSLRPLQAVIQAPPLITTPPKAIVRVNGAREIALLAFTIEGPGGGPCDSLEFGVRVDGGGSALIAGNHITHIRDTPFGGCQNGVAIQVGRNSEGQTGSADITHNQIDDYQKNGVTVDNAGSFAQVDHNTITGAGQTGTIAQNGIQVSRGASVEADHNRISRNNYVNLLVAASTGVLLYGASPHTVIEHNWSFENNEGLYATPGRLVDGAPAPQNNSTVDGNLFTNNTDDGIVFDSGTHHNLIKENTALHNASFDCQDFSKGDGTAGTDNFWINDKGNTSDPPGICRPQEGGDNQDESRDGAN